MKMLTRLMSAALALAAAPAFAQTLLLDATQTVPLAATLDNPCTATPETIVFQGSTAVAQRVWLMPTGTLRLQLAENSALQGNEAAGLTSLAYNATGSSSTDIEVNPLAFGILNYKKVVRDGLDDNFYSVVVFNFNPQSLALDIKLEAACGMP